MGINNKFVFLYVGRVSEEKNIKNIIHAYSKLDNKIDTKLLVVGGGPYLEELKKLVSKVHLEEYVVFTGLIPWLEVPKYYQLGNVFVNASLSETQGLTNIEALASSIPLLIQKDDSVKDLVIDNYNGIYFDGVIELVNKMKYIINNPEYLDSVKKNTFNSVKLYTKEEYSKNILNIYLEAIEIYNNKNK
jgi:1,2-diacylglycerol 3-alpha-glucosyltransferase